jgi:hypothetical protein
MLSLSRELSMRLWPLAAFLGVALTAQAAAVPPRPKAGAPRPAALDDPLVLEAKAFVQKHFALLRLGEMLDASTQVVAGRNIRFTCRVEEEDGAGTWTFVAWRRLDGRWRLQLAERVGD